MSEIAIVATICAAAVPLTALCVGLVCRAMLGRALDHLEKTQTIGGTPIHVYESRAALEAEKRKQALESKRPRPVNRKGVLE